MKIGFTGTQQGMTAEQFTRFSHIVDGLRDTYTGLIEFHHGDCIGADAQAHDFITGVRGTRTVLHPPNISRRRAFCITDETREPLPYLERNHKIVDEVELMFATPKEMNEVLRSGTWATIRYTYKTETDIIIVYPDGDILVRFKPKEKEQRNDE